MRWFGLIIAVVFAIGAFWAFDFFRPGRLIVNIAPEAGQKSTAERIAEAQVKSQNVKGVYVTSGVANDSGRAATRLRNDIIALLDTTELNGLVIDVKETEGGLIITNELRELIRQLHQKGIWVIARQVIFKDSSQVASHPEWYLKRKNNASGDLNGLAIWRDNRRGSWLDPASAEVWAYQLAAAKTASDAGFDEIQFDYIRFPSDGDVKNIVYPVYDSKRPKYEVLHEFFKYLHDNLKRHRPDLILSADLFGYVALEGADLGIGQRLEDIGENFDYVSLMVYPSHYYGGFNVPTDPNRNLTVLYYPYSSKNISEVAAHHPYEVVYRTLLIAGDILAGKTATATDQNDQSPRRPSGLDENDKAAASSPSSSISSFSSIRRARLRPWLQDFDLAIDSARGIRYDAAKVRAQIDAAEKAGSNGWLLWSPDNIYTKEALKTE